METWQAKLVVLFAMFLIAFVSGLIPIKLVDVLRRGGKGRRHARGRSTAAGRYSAVGSEDEDNSDAVRGHRHMSSESSTDAVADDVDESGSRFRCRRTTADCVLDLLNCFAGGVFLATSLLHLLPDVRADIAKVSKELGDSLPLDFPLAEFITSIGFFIVMLIEQLVLHCQKENYSGGSTNRRLHGTSTEPISNTPHCLVKSDEESDSGIISWVADETQQSKTTLLSQNVHSCCGLPGTSAMPSPFLDTDERKSSTTCEPAIIAQYGSIASSQKISNYSQHEKLHNSTQIAEVDNVAVRETSGSTERAAEQNSRTISSSRSFILLLAVSIHTIFEGLAIGLQNNSAGIWTLFIAVALHKAIMGFTSGLRFAESLPSRRHAFAYVLVFALSSPIGIGIGTAVSESGSGGTAADISSAMLQGLATGTFFYVTFFEVLNEQLAHKGDGDNSGHHDDDQSGAARANETGSRGNVAGLIKVLAVAIGFACITVLELMS